MAAAKKLGTTQASISHYLSSKRGEKMVKQLEASPSVQAIVDEIAEGIAADSRHVINLANADPNVSPGR